MPITISTGKPHFYDCVKARNKRGKNSRTEVQVVRQPIDGRQTGETEEEPSAQLRFVLRTA